MINMSCIEIRIILRYIVDFAIKNGCGVIQMEDLSGFTEKAKESFLKNWVYYDLQNKIEYKAKEKGINVEYTLVKL